MNYYNTAKEIFEKIGGKENLVSAAHCATRLRLVVVDNEKIDKASVENIDGVKGAFLASGQLQIILGTGVVNKVYEEFTKIAGIGETTKEEIKNISAQKQNIFKRGIKTIGDIAIRKIIVTYLIEKFIKIDTAPKEIIPFITPSTLNKSLFIICAISVIFSFRLTKFIFVEITCSKKESKQFVNIWKNSKIKEQI